MKNFGANLLVAVTALIICIIIADFSIRIINEIHFRIKYDRPLNSSVPWISENDIIPGEGEDTEASSRGIFYADSKNMRIDEEAPLVLFFGDSVTLGDILNDPEHIYPYSFDKNNRAAHTGEGRHIARNISSPGANTKEIAAEFERVMSSYDFDVRLTVIGYCLNDILTKEHRRGLSGLVRQIVEDRKIRTLYDKDPLSYYYRQEKNLKMTRDAFASIKETSTRYGIPALIVILPFFTDFGDRDYGYQKLHDTVGSLAGDAGLTVLDTAPFFREYRASAFRSGKDMIHFNTMGHKFMADIIYKHVSSEGLIPLPRMDDAPGIRIESDPGRAKNFCDSIYDGELTTGISQCREFLSELIGAGKILTRDGDPESPFFFINFD